VLFALEPDSPTGPSTATGLPRSPRLEALASLHPAQVPGGVLAELSPSRSGVQSA